MERTKNVRRQLEREGFTILSEKKNLAAAWLETTPPRINLAALESMRGYIARQELINNQANHIFIGAEFMIPRGREFGTPKDGSYRIPMGSVVVLLPWLKDDMSTLDGHVEVYGKGTVTAKGLHSVLRRLERCFVTRDSKGLLRTDGIGSRQAALRV